MASKSKFVPYSRQCIADDDIEMVAQVLRSPLLTIGPVIEEFEKRLADYLKVKHVVAVSSGTSALHLMCAALDLNPGDVVFVPAMTFAATANAVLYTGASVAFVDIDPATNGICAKSLERTLAKAKSAGLNPKGVYAVHYAGLPVLSQQLIGLCATEKLPILEDACHALGAEYRLRESESFQKIGAGGNALAAAWSFHPVKHIATGEGGAISTDDDEFAKRVKLLRTHGITKDPNLFKHKARAFDATSGEPNMWYQEMQHLGWNYRLCEIQAALGVSQLRKLPAYVESRRAIAAQYDERLGNLEWLRTPPGDSALARHSYHLYPVRINFKAIGKTRHTVMKELLSRNLGSQVNYVPVFWHPYYQENKSRWIIDQCGEAEKFYEEELSIPVYPSLEESELSNVVETLKKLVK